MSFLSARKKAFLSQREVGEALGVSDAAVCLWETGQTFPRASLLPEIADLYECSIAELLSDDRTFYDVFSQLCEIKGVSCTRAADEIGLSNSITTKWKKTGATPGGETLEKVAEYFGVTTDYLLSRESTERIPDKMAETATEESADEIFAVIQAYLELPAERRKIIKKLLGVSR